MARTKAASSVGDNTLQDVALFVDVAHALSFTRASQISGIPVATLSRRIARLEKRVGVRLFERTTRHFALTVPGRRYLEHCERIVQDAAAARDMLREVSERPKGHLRLSMPVEFGFSLIAPIIGEFTRNYPDVTIDVELSARRANLVDDNIDLAIRLGEISDRGLIVRRLGGATRLLYAAPSYLAKRGEPEHPRELGDHDCILELYRSKPKVWQLVSAKNAIDVKVDGRLSTNNISMMLKFAEQGQGIAALWPPIARAAFDAGAVRQVLPAWGFPPMPVHAVMTSRMVPAHVRAFMDFLASRLIV